MTSIDTLTNYIDTITPTIKNKYVAYNDLNLLIEKMGSLLKVTIDSKNSILSEPHYGLDIIFPAIHYLKLFLDEEDLGSIALVSKKLYNLMVSNFTQLKVDICILHHYIKNSVYDYDVNINFVVEGQNLLVPINISDIANKKLRILIGYEGYWQLYKDVRSSYFRDDYIELYHETKEIRYYDTIVCIFCKKLNLYRDEHTHCAFEYYENTSNKYPDFENIKNIQFFDHGYINIFPELEYYAIQKLKTKMPIKMKYTCKGLYTEGIDYSCSQCGINENIHNIYKNT